MKSQNEMEGQLIKLTSLAPIPLNQSFMLGYLAYGLSNQCYAHVNQPVRFIISSLNEESITPRHALELLVIMKYKKLMKDSLEASRNIRNTIQSYVCQIICDPEYLKKEFYMPEIDEIQKEDKLGQCPICLTQISMKSLCLLGCAHMYHKECFQGFAKEKIINKNFPIICPSEDCKIQVTDNEIKEFLTKQLAQKYEQFIFQNYVDKNVGDTTWCPTPGCKAVFSFDEQLTNYRCPACNKHYCLKCRCFMHTDLSCQQYQKIAHLDEPDRKFMIFIKGTKFKQCPSCKFWVEKNQGCDHMTCRCKYQFCYVCGGKYGQCQCNDRREFQSDQQQDQQQDIEPRRHHHPIDRLHQRQLLNIPYHHHLDMIEHPLHPPRLPGLFPRPPNISEIHRFPMQLPPNFIPPRHPDPMRHRINHPYIDEFQLHEPHQYQEQQENDMYEMQQNNIQIYNSGQINKQQKNQLNQNVSYENFNEAFNQLAVSKEEPYYEKYNLNQSKLSQKQKEEKVKWQLWEMGIDVKKEQLAKQSQGVKIIEEKKQEEKRPSFAFIMQQIMKRKLKQEKKEEKEKQ